jgi:hypothetical protein
MADVHRLRDLRLMKSSTTVIVIAAAVGSVLLVCGGGMCGLMVMGSANRDSAKASGSAAAPPPTRNGPVDDEATLGDFCEVRLKSDENASVPVFESEDGMDEWTSAAAADDEHGQRQAIAKDGFVVSGGTRCKKIEGGFTKVRVRILEGPHTGKAGWVPREWARTVI